MEVVFDTKTLARANAARLGATRSVKSICRSTAGRPLIEYVGLVREARLGEVTITDALISPQSIRRENRHISRFGKDCYYFGIEHIGRGRHPPIRNVIRPAAGKDHYTTPTNLMSFTARSSRVNSG